MHACKHTCTHTHTLLVSKCISLSLSLSHEDMSYIAPQSVLRYQSNNKEKVHFVINGFNEINVWNTKDSKVHKNPHFCLHNLIFLSPGFTVKQRGTVFGCLSLWFYLIKRDLSITFGKSRKNGLRELTNKQITTASTTTKQQEEKDQ